jgi:CRP-like cAMP-binding protein
MTLSNLATADRRDAAAVEWPQPLRRRFQALGGATSAELDALAASLPTPQRWSPWQDLLTSAARQSPMFLLKGWAAAVRTLPDGRRQILRIIVPGDLIGRGAGLGARGGDISALTAVETVSAEDAIEVALQPSNPGIRRALSRAAQIDEQLLLDQITRIGRLSGAERFADLLLELRDRLALVGEADRHRIPMPLTQDILADTLGLSVVHVSRLKGELTQMGLLRLRSGMATLPDPERLARLACRGETRLVGSA